MLAVALAVIAASPLLTLCALVATVASAVIAAAGNLTQSVSHTGSSKDTVKVSKVPRLSIESKYQGPHTSSTNQVWSNEY